MQLRRAKRISTFFLRFVEMAFWRVLALLMHENTHCRAVDVACDLAGVFMLFAADLAHVDVGPALGFRWADVADLFRCAVTRRARARAG